MTDKAWLKEELIRDLMRFNGNPNMTDYELGIASGIGTAINLTEKLEEPEIEENFYTFDNVKKWLQDNGFVVFEKDKLDEEVQRMVDETYEATNEKQVIPQFVADWIDAHNLYGNNPLREYRDLEIDFNEGWTDEKDAEVYHWVNKNPYAFIDALRYGCEVEKEPQWVVRYEDGYFSEEIKFGCGIDGDWVDEVSRAYHFTDKAKAEAVALLIGGTVEEVTK